MTSSTPAPAPTSTPPPALALAPPIPDSPHPTSLPLPLSASLILTTLPHDAHAALAAADNLTQKKVTIRFQAIASAPVLRTKVFKISSSQRFETVVGFLRRRLEVGGGEGVFCYVNSVFAPGLDEGVGGLWRCFKTDDQLIVAYSMTPAFG